MGIIDRIKGNPFEKLKKDELTAERIRLERDEKLKISEVERLSSQKKNLFDKGFKVSEAERRTIARQMQQLDQKLKLENINLKHISDEIRVVDNLVFIQENKAMLERKGLMSKLVKMPKSKLDEFLARVNVKEQIKSGNIDAILRTMEAEYGLLGDIEDDKETKELMNIWSTSDVNKADVAFEEYEKKKSAKEAKDLETA